jgi:hypothetical protein
MNSNMNKLPIVVGGFYRSGTSLLRRLLDSHSAIHCGPEIKFFKDLHGDYYVSDPLRHDRFFSTIATLGLDQSEILDVFGTAFIKSHDLATKKASKVRWADKNPENVLYLSDWRKLLPEGFVFIHILRHPLDVLASLQEARFNLTMPESFEYRVNLLKQFAQAGVDYEKSHPDSSIRIHYEELVENPTEVLQKLFGDLGIPWEPEVLQLYYSAERGHGLEDRKVTKTRSVHTSSVGRWSRDLKQREIDMAVEILGKDFHGYKLTNQKPGQLRWSQ